MNRESHFPNPARCARPDEKPGPSKKVIAHPDKAYTLTQNIPFIPDALLDEKHDMEFGDRRREWHPIGGQADMLPQATGIEAYESNLIH
ncbi:MAG: hypothetical protein M9920_15900 [Verrucomicrobiae bacterium]|nr:hypothetical protein [Verrucomicrobiae bacterium]